MFKLSRDWEQLRSDLWCLIQRTCMSALGLEMSPGICKHLVSYAFLCREEKNFWFDALSSRSSKRLDCEGLRLRSASHSMQLLHFIVRLLVLPDVMQKHQRHDPALCSLCLTYICPAASLHLCLLPPASLCSISSWAGHMTPLTPHQPRETMCILHKQRRN